MACFKFGWNSSWLAKKRRKSSRSPLGDRNKDLTANGIFARLVRWDADHRSPSSLRMFRFRLPPIIGFESRVKRIRNAVNCRPRRDQVPRGGKFSYPKAELIGRVKTATIVWFRSIGCITGLIILFYLTCLKTSLNGMLGFCTNEVTITLP